MHLAAKTPRARVCVLLSVVVFCFDQSTTHTHIDTQAVVDRCNVFSAFICVRVRTWRMDEDDVLTNNRVANQAREGSEICGESKVGI